MRRREQRLAEAISYGAPGDAAPEALLSALRVEETRRKSLEEQLAALPQSTAVVSIDRDYVSRELRARRRCAGRAPPSGFAGTGHASEPSDGSGRLARPCSSPTREATRSPATARSAGYWRPAPGPLPLVAPTGHEPFCTLEFRGVIRAA